MVPQAICTREQAQGRPRPNSDIYALGMIAVQALTGLSPKQLAEDPTSGEIIWRQYAQVSDQLADIISKMVRQYYKYRFHFADEALQALAEITHPNTPTAVAAAIRYALRNYLQERSVSAMMRLPERALCLARSLKELAKSHTPDHTTAPDATQPPVSASQSTVKIPRTTSILPNSSASSRGYVNKYRRMPLFIATGGSIALFVFSIISATPPQQQQPSRVTTENQKIQETIEEKTTVSTQKNTTVESEQQNNCIVVTRASNIRAVSGRRRTGKVIKAGTKVTVTGKKDGGWLEISAPEEGWIWGTRTKNTCTR